MTLNKTQSFLSKTWVAFLAVLPGLFISGFALDEISWILNIVASIAIFTTLVVIYVNTVVRFSNTVSTGISLYVLFIASEVLVFMSVVTALA